MSSDGREPAGKTVGGPVGGAEREDLSRGIPVAPIEVGSASVALSSCSG